MFNLHIFSFSIRNQFNFLYRREVKTKENDFSCDETLRKYLTSSYTCFKIEDKNFVHCN